MHDGGTYIFHKNYTTTSREKRCLSPVSSEVVPWENHATSLPYYDTLRDLRFHIKNTLRPLAEAGDERAQKLLEQAEDIDRQDTALFRLYGKKRIIDPKTGKEKLGWLWRDLGVREENDKQGITEERKKAHEEAERRKVEFEKQAKEIIGRGGFVVDVPIMKKISGKDKEVGKELCAVRLEKTVSKRSGNDMWKVVEMFPPGVGGLRVDQTSQLNMGQFPEWFRKEAKKYFIMHGEDFVERLTYETKE